MKDYIITLLLFILGGVIFGVLMCCLFIFMIWDLSLLDEIFIPIRICMILGFVLGNIKYFATH